METILISLMILIATFLNELPLTIGLLKAKSDFIFLGAIHHAQDYFYYLSQFAMGEHHWFLGFDPLTSDYRNLTLVGWPNIFLGKIFSLMNIDSLYAYQASVIIFTLLFLFLSYKVISKLFDGSVYRLFSFFIFVFANGIPYFYFANERFHISIEDYWFNLGNPLTRLGGVPHQLLANSAILMIFLSFLKFSEKKTAALLIIMILATFILASLNPVQWLLVGLILFLIWIPEMAKTQAFQKKFIMAIPLFAIFAAGLPIVLYLKILFSDLPYRQLADWEAVQLIYPTLSQFVATYGLVGVLGLIGFFLILKIPKPDARAIMGYGILSLTFYFFPLANLLHLTNARFISSVTVLSLACSTTFFLKFVGRKLRVQRILFILTSAIIFTLFIPEFYFQIKNKTHYFTLDNAYFYLPRSELEVFAKAKEVSNENDVFLVLWPFNVSFAGLTGRREYNGHPLLTIDSEKKNSLSVRFFSETPDWQQNFLRKNKILYVITYPWTFQKPRPFLHEVYKNQSLVLYKVE